MLSISLFSCSKSDDVAQALPVVPNTSGLVDINVDLIAFFNASLNGVPLNYLQSTLPSSSHSYGIYNGYQGGPGYFDKSYHYGCFIQPNLLTTDYPQIGITFNNMYNSNSTVSQTNAFYGLFTSTPTNFLTSTQLSNLTKGLDVNYKSATNVSYSSLTGSQTGSLMTVTSVKNGIASGSNLKTVTIDGTINCKLYNNANPSDVITLTNGSFRLIFREFN